MIVVTVTAAMPVESEAGICNYAQLDDDTRPTAAGKANHCERQRAYRRRQFRAVTHQGIEDSAVGSSVKYRNLSSCAICGGQNRWIMPFDLDARRRLIKKTRF